MRDEGSVQEFTRDFCAAAGRGVPPAAAARGDGTGQATASRAVTGWSRDREAVMEATCVMVVDDEQIVCDRLRGHLEKQGFDVDTFTDSGLALQALEERRYHVVVTDLKMAGATGLDILHNVRRRNYPTQVIVITGYASLEVAREAEAVGAHRFICKPFELKELTAAVKSASRRARRGHGPG